MNRSSRGPIDSKAKSAMQERARLKYEEKVETQGRAVTGAELPHLRGAGELDSWNRQANCDPLCNDAESSGK